MFPIPPFAEPFLPKLADMLRGYDRRTFGADLAAGITVGLVALPLAVAFAIASGLGPERGIFTAVVGGFLTSLLGGSRVQVGGPTGAFVVIVSGIAAQHGYAGLACCTVLAGLMLVAMSLAKLGALIRFIPFPVTTGFTTGIAVVIFTTQVKDLPGLRLAEAPAGFLGRWRAYALAAGTVQWAEAAVGIGTAALVFGLRHWRPRWPALLLGMVAATAAAAAIGLPPAERRAPFVPSVERDRGRAPVPGGGLS
jgi:SulP family sulfate permease